MPVEQEVFYRCFRLPEAGEEFKLYSASVIFTILQSRYPAIPGSLYSVRFGGENWDDLVKALQTSDMPDRQAVLDIIDRYSITEGREAKLMALKGGAPWRYMPRRRQAL